MVEILSKRVLKIKNTLQQQVDKYNKKLEQVVNERQQLREQVSTLEEVNKYNQEQIKRLSNETYEERIEQLQRENEILTQKNEKYANVINLIKQRHEKRRAQTTAQPESDAKESEEAIRTAREYNAQRITTMADDTEENDE